MLLLVFMGVLALPIRFPYAFQLQGTSIPGPLAIRFRAAEYLISGTACDTLSSCRVPHFRDRLRLNSHAAVLSSHCATLVFAKSRRLICPGNEVSCGLKAVLCKDTYVSIFR